MSLLKRSWKKKAFNFSKNKNVDQFLQKIKLVLHRIKPQIAPQVVGLDIGFDTVKLIKLNTKFSPYLIENFAFYPLPAGVISKDEIKEPGVLSGIIKDLFKQANVKSKFVAIAIPKSLAIIKNILVSNQLTAEEIESRAWIEANRHFPDLVGDIHLDFVNLGPSPTDQSQVEILLVACRKDHIKAYLDVLKQAGLVAKIVDVNSYALARALPMIEPELAHTRTVALLNINSNLSSFIVINKDILIHAHDQPFEGGRLLTQVKTFMKDNAQLSTDEALQNETRYMDLLRENLISHLRHTIHFFYSSKPNFNIQKIVLAGDIVSQVPLLANFIQREMGIETVTGNPFDHVQAIATMNLADLKQYGPGAMLCCGLALSKLE